MKQVKTTWKHIRRTPYQALIAIVIMSLTFLSISVFAFIVFGSSTVIQYLESRPQVVAFFKDDAEQSQIDALKQKVEKTGVVTKTRFVSKEQALQIYKEQNKEDPRLLDLVSADYLPRSLEVSTNKIEDMALVAQLLRESPIVMEGKQGVIYQKDVVSTLTKWTNGARIVGVALIIILAVVSIFIMMTVIGFKVSQKREEIEIMRLLSATNWYIRWPFMMEGIFYGLVGTMIGWIIASATLFYSAPYLANFMKDIPLFPISFTFLFILLGAELILAIILGIFASSLAVLRYLK